MPSELSASRIRDFLAEGENYDDFAFLFDALLKMRRPYDERLNAPRMWLRRPYYVNLEMSESIVGWLLCLFVPDKPANYLKAMQQFRIRFKGVSSNAELQAEFYNCVRNAALVVRRKEDVVWRPSLYFSLSMNVHEGLEGWF